MRFPVQIIYQFSIMILVLLIFLTGQANGQSQFEGKISYEISNSGDKNVNIPTEYEYYLKDHQIMMRAYLKTGEEMARILLDGNEKTMFMIDDVQKTAVKIHFQEDVENPPGGIPDEYKDTYEKALEQQNSRSKQLQPALTATGKSNVIAGYKCREYQITHPAEQNQPVSHIWLTADIHYTLPDWMKTGENPLFQFLSASGFPLKLIIPSNGDTMEMIAKKVEPKKLKDDLFLVPEGYTISDMSSLLFNR
jgi:hypothetical protein